MNLRQEFPLLAQTNLTYLDSAATTQKPQTVLDEMDRAYRLCNANVHRSPHSLGREMTRRYEAARAEVAVEETRFAPLPARFEAGTPNFIGAVGFARALGWLEEQGMEQVARREQALTRLLWEEVRRITGVVLPLERCPDAGILSFLLPPFSPYDVALLLDQQGVALREGLHCAHPLMQAMGLPQGTIRASLGLYNSEEDIERLCAALRRIASIL